jgi:transcriptional regulator with XRE-family HTH domain
VTINLRQLQARDRELMRAIGDRVRELREDAGLSQARLAQAALISPGHLCAIEKGTEHPSTPVLLRIATMLGADLSIKLFANTGPLVRDHLSLPMGEELLRVTEAAWRRHPEVAVYKPVRGVIDHVLEHREAPDTVATELQSQLRRVEQQIRWAKQKADALAELPAQRGRTVSQLLVLRNTHAMREVARAAHETLLTAYPARTSDAVAALRGEQPWPGSAIVWRRLDEGKATLMDGPPRGVALAVSASRAPGPRPSARSPGRGRCTRRPAGWGP